MGTAARLKMVVYLRGLLLSHGLQILLFRIQQLLTEVACLNLLLTAKFVNLHLLLFELFGQIVNLSLFPLQTLFEIVILREQLFHHIQGA